MVVNVAHLRAKSDKVCRGSGGNARFDGETRIFSAPLPLRPSIPLPLCIPKTVCDQSINQQLANVISDHRQNRYLQ